tara:strand:+ start:1858 stop:2022 length:165 start_codon:yes stop_codon:yes gene_type:complete
LLRSEQIIFSSPPKSSPEGRTLKTTMDKTTAYKKRKILKALPPGFFNTIIVKLN